MSLQYEPISTENILPLNQSHIGLRGPWFILAHVGGGTIGFLALLLFVLALPLQATHLHVICMTVTCQGTQTPSEIAQQLHGLGLSVNLYIAYSLTLQIIFACTYFLVAGLIVWRRANDWMALLGTIFLVTFVLIFTDVPHLLAQAYPSWELPLRSIAFLAEMLFPLFFYLFPNGRFVPRWARWLLIGWVIWASIDSFFPRAPFRTNAWFLAFESLLFTVALSSMVLVQVYRFRRVSGVVQRQQTKWGVFGMVIGLVGFFLMGIVGFVLPVIVFPLFTFIRLPSPVLMGVIAITISYVAMLFIPLSLLMAMLRSKLWEIDIIVNRTLVYGTLTGVLVILYLGGILLIQQFLHNFIAAQSHLILIGSTLAIVSLFQPLQRRIQTVIDRYFYRQKYDTEQMLTIFGGSLRHEVDLEQLSQRLVAVVEETMQPTHVSLWLHATEQVHEAPKYTRHLRL